VLGLWGVMGICGVFGVRYSVDLSEIGKKVKGSLEKTLLGFSSLHIFDLLTGSLF
jgi:hypothetical protein